MILVLHILAFLCFALAVTDLIQDVGNKVRTISLGLACWTLTFIIGIVGK